MNRFLLLLLSISLCLNVLAQPTYKGETNAKGEPDGNGIMLFDEGDKYYTIEALFRDGIPVSGKTIVRRKKDDAVTLRFEGTYYLRHRGVFNGRNDLSVKGVIELYNFEDDKSYKDNGYSVYFTGEDYDSSSRYNDFIQVRTRQREMRIMHNGRWGSWTTQLTPEAEEYYNLLYPAYLSSLANEDSDSAVRHGNSPLENGDRGGWKIIERTRPSGAVRSNGYYSKDGCVKFQNGVAIYYNYDSDDNTYDLKSYYDPGRSWDLKKVIFYSFEAMMSEVKRACEEANKR